MDHLAGAVAGSLMSTAVSLFTRLSPCLRAAVTLLDLYHNYSELVEAILEVFVACGRRLLCYLNTGTWGYTDDNGHHWSVSGSSATSTQQLQRSLLRCTRSVRGSACAE